MRRCCTYARILHPLDIRAFSILKRDLNKLFLVVDVSRHENIWLTWDLSWDTFCRNKRGVLQNRSVLKSYQTGSPMKKVNLDFLGPLPRTENEQKMETSIY